MRQSSVRPSEHVQAEADLALRLTVPSAWAEVAGAILRERLGSYAEEAAYPGLDSVSVTLVFFPSEGEALSDDEILSLLPAELRAADGLRVDRERVPRDWVEGWKDHFHPVIIGRVRVRPSWEPAADVPAELVDVVINPGLGFGTGLHPTTRGTLTLLQEQAPAAVDARARALVDAGTGSGILSIAAAKLGWRPVVAFDNDAVALASTRENVLENGVADAVQVRECRVEEAPPGWFTGATVLANMTLEPVLVLLRRVAESLPYRLVVSGILSGAQEEELVAEAQHLGLRPGRRVYETEWVSLELFPVGPRD